RRYPFLSPKSYTANIAVCIKVRCGLKNDWLNFSQIMSSGE
ncbi:20851_t:CDS:1, partial [Racocetra persica]